MVFLSPCTSFAIHANFISSDPDLQLEWDEVGTSFAGGTPLPRTGRNLEWNACETSFSRERPPLPPPRGSKLLAKPSPPPRNSSLAILGGSPSVTPHGPSAEAEFFRSFLNTTRQEHRDRLNQAAKSFCEVKPLPTNSAVKSSDELDTEKEAREKRQKEGATRKYFDFLLHKRHQTARERLYDLRKHGYKIPEGREYFSFVEDQPVRRKESSRHYSFPMEKDRLLREPSILQDLSKESGKGQTEQLTEILDEGPIEWDEFVDEASKPGSFKMHENRDSSTPPKRPKSPKPQSGGFDIPIAELIDSMKDDKDQVLDYLIEDVYYPGVIDDAVNGKIDFNQIVFNLSFEGCDIPTEAPPADQQPMSLVEAFDKRVERHKGAIKKTTMQSAAREAASEFQNIGSGIDGTKKPDGPKTNFMTLLKEKGSLTRILNREELVLASTVGIDVSTIVQNRPVNELIKALNSLQKAEYMNDYDKSAQAAEEAFKKAPPELAESAAIFGARNFRTLELTKKTADIELDKSYKPVEVVSYVGITKPIPDVRIK